MATRQGVVEVVVPPVLAETPLEGSATELRLLLRGRQDLDRCLDSVVSREAAP